jgi:hypothetical protein
MHCGIPEMELLPLRVGIDERTRSALCTKFRWLKVDSGGNFEVVCPMTGSKL